MTSRQDCMDALTIACDKIDEQDAELKDLYARCRILGERLAECSAGQIELVETISRLRTALEECIEWFHERADGEYIDGKPVGNAEMKMEMFLREVRYD